MKKLNFLFLLVFLNSCGSYVGFGGTGESSCIFIDRKDLKNEVILDVQFINQIENYCGPASLAMVLMYYGENYTQIELAELMGISTQGVSPNQILKTAKELGYSNSSKANCELDVLLYTLSNRTPVIVRTYDSEEVSAHYMVVVGYNIKKELIYINDPAYNSIETYNGTRTISFSEFELIWNINSLGSKYNSYNLMLMIK